MISRRHSLGQLAALTGVSSALLWAGKAYSATYLDTAQAQHLLLPQAERFTPVALPLSSDALKVLAETSQTHVPRNYAPLCWQGFAGAAAVGWALTDRALGKFELIDLAAGFGPDGHCTGVEIMAYRETHGAEIRSPAWRRQFAGRKGPSAMRAGDDIRNISGATLSCQHVTEAVQRLAALVSQLAKA